MRTRVTLARLFLHDTSPAEICTLSLRDALPISVETAWVATPGASPAGQGLARARSRRHRSAPETAASVADRKSTRLNSSHRCSSYAVFCSKKKIARTGKLSRYQNTALQLLHHHL